MFSICLNPTPTLLKEASVIKVLQLGMTFNSIESFLSKFFNIFNIFYFIKFMYIFTILVLHARPSENQPFYFIKTCIITFRYLRAMVEN